MTAGSRSHRSLPVEERAKDAMLEELRDQALLARAAPSPPAPALAATAVATAARGPLVVRLCNWVGEVVLSIPALRRLEAAGYSLRLVGKSWAGSLLEGATWPVERHPGGILAGARQLRLLRHELQTYSPGPLPALLFTKSLSSAMEARLAGLAAAGYAYDGRSPLLARPLRRPEFRNAARSYWDLVSAFLGSDAPYPTQIEYSPSLPQRRRALQVLATQCLKPGEYVLLCPFSGADDRENRKVWPGYAQLATALKRRGIPTVICPGPNEEPAAANLCASAVLPNQDLGTYAALLALSRCVVANDTGPGHLAAAVGTRLISLYGPHSVTAWRPLGSQVTVIHRPEWPPVQEILEAALGPTV